MKPLDGKLKARWVKALRSGKYKQARSVLFNGQAYCCLGVLDVLLGVPKEKIEDNDGIAGGCQKVLPHKIREELANMNDEGGRFTTIANYIEKNL